MKALVVQPVDIVGPGLIKDELEKAGWLLDIRLMDQPGSFLPDNLTGFNALIILGGRPSYGMAASRRLSNPKELDESGVWPIG